MPYIFVSSLEYGDLFQRLLSRRLTDAGAAFTHRENGVLVQKDQAAAGAISDCILKDLRPTETARLTGLLPISLRERRAILPRALELADPLAHRERTVRTVLGYMQTEDVLIAEGFLRFRLPFVMESWALAVDRAGEELVMGAEYAELLRLFGMMTAGGSGELVVILHGDGSAVITDESGARIESSSSDEASLLPLLIGLAPELVTVYDLTGGTGRRVLNGIRAVFGDRACFFIARE